MSNPTLKWGIMGAARVNERLLPAIMQAENAQLVAIASRREGAASATLEKYAPSNQRKGLDVIKCYDTPEALLYDDNIDAIYCPMANEEHAKWALQAIAAGKHILIEKPMATRLADIEMIADAAAKSKVLVMEGFMYRFHPQHRRLQAIIESGLIGDVLSARASFSFLMKPARLYRINRPMQAGGGAMWDIGPYAIHSLRWCFANQHGPAEPRSVIAQAKRNEHGADTVTSGVLDFGADAQGRARYGHFDISFERSRKSEYEIIGTQGWVKCHAAWVFEGDVPVISWATEDGRAAEEHLLPHNHFQLEIEHFSRCVLQGTAPHLSLADAAGNCRTIEAVLESVIKQQAITLGAANALA